MIELENTLAHISQLYNHKLNYHDENVNLEKAYDHLIRATLDCYKLLWVHIYEQLKVIEKNESNRKLGLNISEAEFRTKLQTLRKMAQEARGIEMSLVGVEPIASLDKYKEVVKFGYELIDTIDENKIQEIKSLKTFISTKEFITGIVAGILTGLISGYMLLFI
ncbi:MAG: hypothetical protein Q7J10_07575 [Methanosarcinaceae archaeon]|nr:hypothetical protein [Methanosarcinaceae archaeon]